MLLKKEFKEDTPSFLILYAGFAIGAAIFFSFTFQRSVQSMIVIAIGLYYFLWGIWHHYKKGNLCVKVAAEYLLFAILGTSIILATVLRT